MDETDDALMGATTDTTDMYRLMVILLGFHAANLLCVSPHYCWGISMGFQLMVPE